MLRNTLTHSTYSCTDQPITTNPENQSREKMNVDPRGVYPQKLKTRADCLENFSGSGQSPSQPLLS